MAEGHNVAPGFCQRADGLALPLAKDLLLGACKLVVDRLDHRECLLDQRVGDPVEQIARAAAHQLCPRMLVAAGGGEHAPERSEAPVVQRNDIVAPDEQIELGRAADALAAIEHREL